MFQTGRLHERLHLIQTALPGMISFYFPSCTDKETEVDVILTNLLPIPQPRRSWSWKPGNVPVLGSEGPRPRSVRLALLDAMPSARQVTGFGQRVSNRHPPVLSFPLVVPLLLPIKFGVVHLKCFRNISYVCSKVIGLKHLSRYSPWTSSRVFL